MNSVGLYGARFYARAGVMALILLQGEAAIGAPATISIDTTVPVSTEYEFKDAPIAIVVNGKEQYCGLELQATDCTFDFPDGQLFLELVVKLRGSEATVFEGTDLKFEPVRFTLTPIDVESPLNIRIAPVSSKWNNRKLVDMAAEAWVNHSRVDERRLQVRFQEARAAWMSQRRRLAEVSGSRPDDYTIKAAFLLVQAASKLARAVPPFRADADTAVRQACEFIENTSAGSLQRALGVANDKNAREGVRIINVSRAIPLTRAWRHATEALPSQRYKMLRQYEMLFMKSVPDSSQGKELVAETGISLPVILQAEAAALADDARCRRLQQQVFRREASRLIENMERRIYRETSPAELMSIDEVCAQEDVKVKAPVARLCARHREITDLMVASTISTPCNQPAVGRR